jgi:hypothetical protein
MVRLTVEARTEQEEPEQEEAQKTKHREDEKAAKDSKRLCRFFN